MIPMLSRGFLIALVFAAILHLGESVHAATVSASAAIVNEGSSATVNWSVNGWVYPYDEKFGSGAMTYSAGGTTNFNKSYNSDYVSGTFTESFPDDGVFPRTISGYAYYKRYYIPNGLLDSSGYMNLSKNFSITVHNVAPTITSLTTSLTVNEAQLFDFSAGATDPGVLDTLTYNWDMNADGAYTDYTGQSGQWSYAELGDHLVTVEVSDGDGGFATGSFAVTVVPEPSALALLAVGIISAFVFACRRRIAQNQPAWRFFMFTKAGLRSGVLLVMLLLFLTNLCSAEVIQYDNGSLQTSYSGGWGYYFADRFTNSLTTPVEIDAVLVRRTPSGGAADVYFWQDNNGTPGDLLGGPVLEFLDNTWQRVDVSSMNLSVPAGGSIFAGFEPRSTAQIPYDSASPGAGRSWWDEWGTGDWVQGGPTGETSNLMVRLEVTPVPEPAAFASLASGTLLVVMCGWWRRKRKH